MAGIACTRSRQACRSTWCRMLPMLGLMMCGAASGFMAPTASLRLSVGPYSTGDSMANCLRSPAVIRPKLASNRPLQRKAAVICKSSAPLAPVSPDTTNNSTTSAEEEVSMRPASRSPIQQIRYLFTVKAPKMGNKQAMWWLVVVVALCGLNFGFVKLAGNSFDTPTILAGRFLVATLCLLPWLKDVKRDMIPVGVETGLWLAAGSIAQGLCLSGGTTAGVTSFFASMSSIVCPFLERMYGVRLTMRTWAAAGLAVLGAGFLALDSGGLPTAADMIGLLQPLLFGIYLFRSERAIKKYPSKAMELTAVQVAVVTISSVLWGVSAGIVGLPGAFETGAGALTFAGVFEYIKEKFSSLMFLAWMGLGPTAFVLAMQIVVVAKLSSSVTALTFCMEPLFAATFGAMFLGETCGVNAAIGGMLAIAACVVRNANGIGATSREKPFKLKERFGT